MAIKGQTAHVHYKGTLDDGTVFDSSEGRDPLTFKVGAGMVIPGFDEAVRKLKVGESTSVHIPAKEAYGEYDERNVMAMDLEKIPNSEKLPVGQKIYLRGPQGQPIPAKVSKIEDGKAYFDFNHELAGKDLNFDITLVSLDDDAAKPAPAGNDAVPADGAEKTE